MIDKSIRADYAIQGGGPNYLGKQKMVKAPKKWQSSPDHDPAELAYITEKEKDILIALDVHGSLKDGKPNRGPSGIISLQGDLGGYDASPSGGRNGGGDGHAHPGIASTYSPPPPTVTRSRIQEEKQKKFEEDQKARVREILTRGRGTETPGERLFEDRISKGAVNEIDPETGKYNAEAIQKAAKTQARERALGIGTPLTTEEITSLPLGTRIEDLVPTPEKTDTRTLTQKLTQPTFTKEGITKTATDFAKKQAINLAAQKAGLSGVLSFANPLMALYGFLGGGKKDPLRGIRKQISKFKKPDIDTQEESTKKLVKGPPRNGGDGEATLAKIVAGGENVIAKAINQFAGTEVEGQIQSLVQNNLNQALRYYSDMHSRIEKGYSPNRQEMDVFKLLEHYLNEAAPKQPMQGGSMYI